MSKNRNIARKTAPEMPPAQPEPKRIKLLPAQHDAAINAMESFQEAMTKARKLTEEAQAAQLAASKEAKSHDLLFRALIEGAGLPVEDFQHGWDLRDGYLCAKPAPAVPKE